MSTRDPEGGQPSAPAEPAATRSEPPPPAGELDGRQPKKRRSRWVWVSAVLLLVAVGLGVWALSAQSDLDSTEDDLAQLQANVEEGAENGSDAVAKIKRAYEDLKQQLGLTNADLAATEDDLEEAEQAAAKAEKDAAAAKADAADAKDATDKAQAEADQAAAEKESAESKAAIAADCASAYVSAFGTLFEGDDAEQQASAANSELEGISAQCKAALEGA